MVSKTAQLLKALEAEGPMTAHEMCEAIGSTHVSSSKMVSLLTKPNTRHPKRIYIKSYITDAEGQKRYPRAIYDLGDKPDAKKPSPSEAENSNRWRDSKKLRVSCVWDLGLKVKERLSA